MANSLRQAVNKVGPKLVSLFLTRFQLFLISESGYSDLSFLDFRVQPVNMADSLRQAVNKVGPKMVLLFLVHWYQALHSVHWYQALHLPGIRLSNRASVHHRDPYPPDTSYISSPPKATPSEIPWEILPAHPTLAHTKTCSTSSASPLYFRSSWCPEPQGSQLTASAPRRVVLASALGLVKMEAATGMCAGLKALAETATQSALPAGLKRLTGRPRSAAR